jgi:uncharacterized repeat protein (TIGR03843 family)
MDKFEITNILLNGELDMEGQLLAGSNYTFLVEVHLQGQQFKAIYKPVRGEQPLWDFPEGSLAKRESAAYVLSEALGWDLVPPTIFRRKGPLGPGSLQFFIEHKPELHYFNLDAPTRQRLRPAALFDLLANNADRKGGHILMGQDDHIWLIDHGICFHVEDKLRTVIWDFSGEEIPAELLADVCRLMDDLDVNQTLCNELGALLSAGEVRMVQLRARRLVETRLFPHPTSTRRSYPWPPV